MIGTVPTIGIAGRRSFATSEEGSNLRCQKCGIKRFADANSAPSSAHFATKEA